MNNNNPISNIQGKVNEDGNIPEYVKVLTLTDMNGRKRKMYIPASLDLDRPKRPRTIFTRDQIQILEYEFMANHFISDTRRKTLALILGLSETQIKVWFQNRRTKLKKIPEEKQKGNEITSSFSYEIFIQRNDLKKYSE